MLKCPRSRLDELQLSQNIKIAGGNDATTIELPYLIQQSLFRIGERQGAASVGAMIEHQQIGFDALGERGEFSGRGMIGSTIPLPFSGDLLIGRLRSPRAPCLSPCRTGKAVTQILWSV